MKSNKKKSDELTALVREYFERHGHHLEPEFSVDVGINREPKKEHKFDLGNQSLLIECKAYDWMSGNKTPSAKLSTLNEALLYFISAHKDFSKFLFLRKTKERTYSNGSSETLAAYYVRTYKHLFPEGLKLFELEQSNGKAIQLYPSETNS